MFETRHLNREIVLSRVATEIKFIYLKKIEHFRDIFMKNKHLADWFDSSIYLCTLYNIFIIINVRVEWTWRPTILHPPTKTWSTEVLQLCTAVPHADWTPIYAMWLAQRILTLRNWRGLLLHRSALSEFLVKSRTAWEDPNSGFAPAMGNHRQRSSKFHSVPRV